MFGSQPPDAPQREHEWKLAHLRSNAVVGLALSLAALGSSLFIFVPPLLFLATALALGVFLYLSWALAALRPHLVWLVPVALGTGVFLAVQASQGAPRAMSTVQFVASFAVGMFACFTLERAKRASTDEQS